MITRWSSMSSGALRPSGMCPRSFNVTLCNASTDSSGHTECRRQPDSSFAFCWPAISIGAAPGILSRGTKNSGGLGGRGTATTLTKSLDPHDYHKCHRSTLEGGSGPQDLPRPPPPLNVEVGTLHGLC